MTEKFVAPVSFPEMVERLFKKMPGPFDDHMHAAIGISGEVGELHNADSRKNIIEECGDLEFYLQAYLNKLNAQRVACSLNPYQRFTSVFDEHSRAKFNLGIVLASATVIASEILDLTKKSWVYGKGLDEVFINQQLNALAYALDSIYVLIGTNYDEVVNKNQEKLIGPEGRFKDGFYSDASAINRADKVAEEAKTSERKFIGQKSK